ncbi:glycosyl transferase family 2 [Haloferacaceae archaeon DSL9]
MEYVQERIATLHDITGESPEAPTDRAAVIVPMTERECAGLAADGVLSALEAVDPERVVVPLRADASRVGRCREWLTEYDLPIDVLWCGGPRVSSLLADHGLDETRGKGRDVWLALGRVLDSPYVVFHDADTKTYTREYVPRLLFPLANGCSFSKGYYARVENDALYGRLFRLFYAPLVRTLGDEHDADVLSYLDAFRYALAGEFAVTADLARELRIHPSWGLEVGTLGDAFAHAGFEGSAQVDLGRYEHDHRAVRGPTGLSEMSRAVAGALFGVLEEHGVVPSFRDLPDRYEAVAAEFVRRYGLDAGYNGLDYDRAAELEQVDRYAAAIEEPADLRRLPAWEASPVSPGAVADAAAADLDAATE